MSTNAAKEKLSATAEKVMRLGELQNKKALAYETLKRSILLNEQTPGHPINENALSQEIKVSKTPIREALQQLEREGFIMTIPGRGSFVTPVTVEDVREIFECREIIECAVARRAALIGDKELIRAKKREFESLKPMAVGEANLEDYHDDAHVIIFEVVGNKRLFAIYSNLLDQIIRIRNYFKNTLDTERIAHDHQEHMRILDALIEGDPDKTEEAVLTHLRNASAYLTRLTLT